MEGELGENEPTAGGLEQDKDVIQGIEEHVNCRAGQLSALQQVGKRVDNREAPTHRAGCALRKRGFAGEGEVESTEASRLQLTDEQADEILAPARGDVLQDDDGMDEIEARRSDRVQLTGWHEVDIVNLLPGGIPGRFPQHGRRDIDGNEVSRVTGERNCDTAHTATKIERVERVEVRAKSLPEDAQDMIHVLLPAGEKRGQGRIIQCIAAVLRVREHSIVGINIT